ncbi:MAG: M23 family metallopeptidase [Myxococcales bacterium]|nr:M23 family metallopeptidase [Myxococcales bacterium]
MGRDKRGAWEIWTGAVMAFAVTLGCASPGTEVGEPVTGADGKTAAAELSLSWPIEGARAEDLSSTFGPRLKASEGFRYDFHRGIDIPAPQGTPVVAVADGEVRIAGEHPTYSDALVQVRHYRDGEGRCSANAEGCFYSNYMHLSQWTVKPGERVYQGQIIGYTGTSESGFEHLHFEIRSGGIYQQHAIHPLRMLPVGDASSPGQVEMGVELGIQAEAERVEVTVSLSRAALNLEAVAVQIQGRNGDIRYERLFDMALWNRVWTHTEEEWPAQDCPFHASHPEAMAYEPNVHTDNPSFNDIVVEPARFNRESSRYELTLRFSDLPLSEGETLVVVARDVQGREARRAHAL